jgi:hypothetical protein
VLFGGIPDSAAIEGGNVWHTLVSELSSPHLAQLVLHFERQNEVEMTLTTGIKMLMVPCKNVNLIKSYHGRTLDDSEIYKVLETLY